MPEPPVIGPALRDHRTARNWTLDKLASESGVSRSMLSEIERGDANPTFATLWNITGALGLEINDLMRAATAAPDSPQIEITAPALTPTMSSPDGQVTLRALSPVHTADTFEWYELTFAPHGQLASAPHTTGTMEHLTVTTGQVEVQISESTEKIETGATARYRGDLPHTLANPSNTHAATALLVVIGGHR